jgi:hypothetical protein
MPEIPDTTTSAPTTTQPPTTEKSYDLTGMGAGPFETLINSATSRRVSPPTAAWYVFTAVALGAAVY